jgi:hypothetical protein
MNFFDHKDLGNYLLQLCPKIVKHPVYIYIYIYMRESGGRGRRRGREGQRGKLKKKIKEVMAF